MTQYHLNEDKVSFEVVSFKTEAEAKKFLEKTQTTKDMKALAGKDLSVNSGTLMTPDVLINHWRVPQPDALRFSGFKKGSFSEVIPTGENFSVFKITEAKPASEKMFTADIKKQYAESFKNNQKQEGFILWMKQLQLRANLKDYQQNPA